MSSRAETRARILRAARRTFGERGFHDTRVDDIARDAEVGRATFYLHFAKKDEVFAAIVDEIGRELVDVARCLEPVTPDAAGRDALRAWVGLLYDLVSTSAPFIAAWSETGSTVDDADLRGESAFVDFASLVGAKLRAGGVPDIKPRVTAMAMVAMVDRFVVQVQLGDLDLTGTETVDVLSDLLFEMLHPAAWAS